MAQSTFTPTTLTVPAAAVSGTGQGELNVVTNPSAATDLTGWTASVPANASRQATGSPLDPVVATGFQLTSTGAGQTLTASALTVPTSLRNRKLKLEFYMTQATAAFKVDVLNSSGVRFALTTDASGASNLPALSASGKYTTYFDMDSGSTISVRFTSILATGTLSFTQVIVGPGIQPQGAVVGEWQSYTPASGLTNATHTGRYRRVGSNIELRIDIAFSGAPAGSFSFTQSNYLNGLNLTVDSTALPNTTDTVINAGSWAALDSGVNDRYGGPVNLAPGATNSLSPVSSAGVPVSSTAPFTFGAGDNYSLWLTLPIAEWAGSGTVQLAQNDVEYLSNTDTSTSVSNTTSFAYGPAGQSIVAVSSAGTWVKKRVQLQAGSWSGKGTPLVKVSPDGVLWLTAGDVFPASQVSGNFYGIDLQPVSGSTTQVDVAFGGNGANSTQAWSSFTSYKWRVDVAAPGQAVGFGIVQPGVSSGLVSASGLPGNTTGNVIATGYVGEKVTWVTPPGNQSLTTTTADWTNATITLTAGIWLITANVSALIASSAAAGNNAFVQVTDSANAVVQNQSKQLYVNNVGANAAQIQGVIPFTFIAALNSTTTYKLRVAMGISGGSGSVLNSSLSYSEFFAIRIA